MYAAYRWLWSSLDWLYPPRCGGCGKVGNRWCEDCASATHLVGADVCQRCGNPHISSQPICPSCRYKEPSYRALRSWAYYDGPIRNAIKRLKYQGDVALGEILARPLIGYLKSLSWPIDVLLPVPSGHLHQQDRGYNQAAMMARPLALGCKLPYKPQAIKKIKETRSQVGLGWDERRANVEGAFRANPKWVKKKKVLIVDDVTTSGATIEACANALLAAGASEVYGLTLTRPYPRPDQPVWAMK